MKKYYSIGEVSKIYGLSVQALRHYHKIGLIVPETVDKNTGYRYYTFDQFQFISRLKYLQTLGLSLIDIGDILSDGNADKLKNVLLQIKKDKQKEIDNLERTIREIDWTLEYYSDADRHELEGFLYKKKFDTRYVVATPEHAYSTTDEMDVHLHQMINSKPLDALDYRRHFGYILDFEKLKNSTIEPISATLTVVEPPALESSSVKTLPAGNYLCYSTYILNEACNLQPIYDFFKQHPELDSDLVIAMEYEDHLREYYNAIYEIQIYLSPTE